MAILSSTISEWEPFEASLLEWRRLCKRMQFLDSSQDVDADSDHTHLGEVLVGVEVKDGSSQSDAGRVLGVARGDPERAWRCRTLWASSRTCVLKDETGALVTPAKLVLHLNAAVSGFRWQGRLIRDAGAHRDMAA